MSIFEATEIEARRAALEDNPQSDWDTLPKTLKAEYLIAAYNKLKGN
jgi:hypothetical protein